MKEIVTQKEITIETQEELIIHFFQTMDIEMIEGILDNDLIFQGLEKSIFISKLQVVFDKFKSAGDTFLNIHPGVCDNCCKGYKGFSFIGNHSNNFIDILFETDNGKIGLTECLFFKFSVTGIIRNQGNYIDRWGHSEPPF